MIIRVLSALALTGGEWVIYILALCSVMAMAVMIERGMVLAKERKDLRRIQELFLKYKGEGDYAKLPEALIQSVSLAGVVISGAFEKIGAEVESIEEKVLAITLRERQRLETRMIIIGTLGNNAVYIGLFGTVLGVIKAFHDLAQSAQAGPEIVMQGLSEALLATAVGLLVALPCVIAYNVLNKKIDDILLETDSMVHHLLAEQKSNKGK